MSDQTPSGKPTPPSSAASWDITSLPKSAEDLRKAAQNIKFPSIEELGDLADEKLSTAPPKVQKAVGRSANLYLAYKREIAVTLIALLFLKLYKRRISRAAVVKTLKTLEASGKVNSSNLHSILEALRAYPGQAVMDPSNGMVHLLKGRDVIVTVFGDFDRMSTEELWNQVAKILNLGVTIDPRIAR